MSEITLETEKIILNKKNFSIEVHQLRKYLKEQTELESLIGVNFTGNKFEILFSETVDSEIEQQVISAYNSIDSNTFAQENAIKHTKQLGDNAEIFGKELMSKFRGENILMGITQAGKSGAVLSIMVEKVNVNNDGFPVSVKEATETGTLYEAIKAVEYHIAKAQAGDYDSIAPFITVERLENFKSSIVEYLNG